MNSTVYEPANYQITYGTCHIIKNIIVITNIDDKDKIKI